MGTRRAGSKRACTTHACARRGRTHDWFAHAVSSCSGIHVDVDALKRYAPETRKRVVHGASSDCEALPVADAHVVYLAQVALLPSAPNAPPMSVRAYSKFFSVREKTVAATNPPPSMRTLRLAGSATRAWSRGTRHSIGDDYAGPNARRDTRALQHLVTTSAPKWPHALRVNGARLRTPRPCATATRTTCSLRAAAAAQKQNTEVPR